MDVLTILSMACTIGLYSIARQQRKRADELEAENERLKAEIESLKNRQ